MTPTYRFFPWVRRGLSAALPEAAGPLPVRALARVKITITPEIVEEREIRLLGPGDIVGIDPRLIVRTEPRAGIHDFEPNYMAAIEFDAPELPWLFTPAGAGPDGRLQPWIVLIVLDREKVDPPRVTRNRPMPFIKVPGALPDTELPRLADSWAWAHAQRLVAAGDSGADSQEFLETPDLNVSRLVCPRRLAPNRQWLACVVPTFDAGVATGLGVPRANPDSPLQPAWSPGRSDLELPVYFHWEFETAEAGDFEFLARRLQFVRATANDISPEAQRRARVYLGAVDGKADTLALMPADSPASYARVDAPLEMIDRQHPNTSEASQPYAVAVARATAPAVEGTDELLPPIYGDRHARRFTVDPAQMGARWLDELNLDPRTRLAARFGGDTVRRFQEDLMQAAWAQVGDVLAANAQLSRSRFLALVAQRGIERHVANLPAERFLAVTSVMHGRVRAGDLTVRGRVAATSLADAAFDPALRRLTSPVGRLSRAVARGFPLNQRTVVSHALARGIAQALQRSEVAVDPSVTPRDGISGLRLAALVTEQQPVTPGMRWTAGPGAEGATFDAAILSRAAGDTTASVAPRPDLATVGVLTESHLKSLASAAQTTGQSYQSVMEQVMSAARSAPDATYFAFQRASVFEPQRLVAIEQSWEGALSVFDFEKGTRTQLFTVDSSVSQDAAALTQVVASTPRMALATGEHTARVETVAGRPDIRFTIRENRFASSHVPVVRRAANLLNAIFPSPSVEIAGSRVPAEEKLFDVVIPAPLRDATAIANVSAALNQLGRAQPAAVAEPVFIKADMRAAEGGMADGVLLAIQPQQTFRARVSSMVKAPLWLRAPDADVLDPIVLAPVFSVSFAELLARTAPDRFLPPDLDLPDEAITVLRTNPRFVGAFMVGANHEMNRELIWRTYPSDGRGTPAKRFWNWFEPSRRDVDAIHAWLEPGPLVARVLNGVAQVVLVIRGRLLRRYPNTIVLAWRAQRRGALAAVPDDPLIRRTVLREPSFKTLVEPDIALVGFDLTVQEFASADDPLGWYIVLQEPITEPRFGLDEPGTPAGRRHSRNDLNWSSTGVVSGGHLAAVGGVLAGSRTSADIANRLLQRPVRVAIHSTQIAPALEGWRDVT